MSHLTSTLDSLVRITGKVDGLARTLSEVQALLDAGDALANDGELQRALRLYSKAAGLLSDNVGDLLDTVARERDEVALSDCTQCMGIGQFPVTEAGRVVIVDCWCFEESRQEFTRIRNEEDVVRDIVAEKGE